MQGHYLPALHVHCLLDKPIPENLKERQKESKKLMPNHSLYKSPKGVGEKKTWWNKKHLHTSVQLYHLHSC